jgi:hypothetical protein
MKTTLVMLAVTEMKTGVCIAGVRRDAPNLWVRPVREFGTILLGDITYPSGQGAGGIGPRVMRPFDIVELALGKPRHEPPHVEDWTCDFAHDRPRLIGVLPVGERAALLEAAAGTPETVWRDQARSLGTLAVSDVTATFRHDTYNGKYEARLAFPGLPHGTASAPCTDLKWRAWGRKLLESRRVAPDGEGVHTLTVAGAELRAALGVEDVWLALGTTRNYQGHYWPLVVGVHTLPDYEADVDYHHL